MENALGLVGASDAKQTAKHMKNGLKALRRSRTKVKAGIALRNVSVVKILELMGDCDGSDGDDSDEGEELQEPEARQAVEVGPEPAEN